MTFNVSAFYSNKLCYYDITTVDWETFHCKLTLETKRSSYDHSAPVEFTLTKGQKFKQYQDGTEYDILLKQRLLERIQAWFEEYGTILP